MDAYRHMSWRWLVVLFCIADWHGSAQSQPEQASCRLNGENQTCSMRAMQGLTQVFPGGKTRCISRKKPEYAFSVFPGVTNKLLLYFEAGGACIDPITTAMRACDEDIDISPPTADGIFNRQLATNAFRNFTVVYITYCSGDLFSASIKKPYGEQFGLVNTRAAVDWAKANVATHLDSLVLMGCSGGSLGVQLWARTLLQSFSYERAAVVADSFICVMPLGAQGMLLNSYGVCDNGLLSVEVAAQCRMQNLTIQRVFESTIADFPSVSFASINSKNDVSQIHYYNLVAKIFKAKPPFIDASLFFSLGMYDLAVFNKYPNYVSFWVNGQQHCFTQFTTLYTADANGIAGSGGITVGQWLDSLVMRPGILPASSQCAGQPFKQADWPLVGTDYCDAAQVGKTYTLAIAATPAPEFAIAAGSIPTRTLLATTLLISLCCLAACGTLCYLCFLRRNKSPAYEEDAEDEESDDLEGTE